MAQKSKGISKYKLIIAAAALAAASVIPLSAQEIVLASKKEPIATASDAVNPPSLRKSYDEKTVRAIRMPDFTLQSGATFVDDSKSIDYCVITPQKQENEYGSAYTVNALTNGKKWKWIQAGIVEDLAFQDMHSRIKGFEVVIQAYDNSMKSDGVKSVGLPKPKTGETVCYDFNITPQKIFINVHNQTTQKEAPAITYNSDDATTFIGMERPYNEKGVFSGLLSESFSSSGFVQFQHRNIVTFVPLDAKSHLILWSQFRSKDDKFIYLSNPKESIDSKPTVIDDYPSLKIRSEKDGKITTGG